jgi:hypothetical protein
MRNLMKNGLPDVRDGLAREERAVLRVLHELQQEVGPERGVRAAAVYGRVLEQVDMSQREFMRILRRLSSLRAPLLE